MLTRSLTVPDTDAPGVLALGLAGRQLGSVAPQSSVRLDLRVVAVSPGLQTVGGVSLRDDKNGRLYTFDRLFDVFVRTPTDAPLEQMR